MSAGIIPFQFPRRRGEIVVTPLSPDRFCVDYYTAHADPVCMLASNIPSYGEALAVAADLACRLGVAFDRPAAVSAFQDDGGAAA